MPNQNQPDPNQNPQQNIGGDVPFSPQADLPPLPPEFQNIQNEAGDKKQASPAEAPTNEGSAAPPTPEISNIVPSPKKKFGTGKIIATILSILLVVGGVGAGTYLVGQKQIFQQKAAGEMCSSDSRTASVCQGKSVGDIAQSCWKGFGDTDPSNDTSLKCESSGIVGNDGKPLCAAIERSTSGACGGGDSGGSSTSWPSNGASCQSTGGNPGTIGGCVTYFCPNGCGGKCGEGDPGVYIERYGTCGEAEAALGNYCGQVDTVDTNGSYCIPTTGKDSKIQCTSCTNPPPRTETTPTPTPIPPRPILTPTPTPVAAAPYCGAVLAYDSSWGALSSAQLSALKEGDSVNFCVSGNTTSGTFDMARFTINGTQMPDTTTKRPNSVDFCQSYTIPGGKTTFTVSAKIHHSTLGWF